MVASLIRTHGPFTACGTTIVATVAIILLVVGATAATAAAQERNFWTNQYGARSALRGGAVVGGVRDTSAVYYNPAGLALIDQESLSVSATAYAFGELRVENGAGTGDDLVSAPFEQVPLLVSGMTWLDDQQRHAIGFALLARHKFAASFSARRDDIGEVVARYTGDEEYVGQFIYNGNLDELWAGVSYSFEADETFAVGVTLFGAMRNETYDVLYRARAINVNSSEVVTSSTSSGVTYTDVRAFLKFGAMLDLDGWRIGISVTTPSLHLFGEATVNLDLIATNIDLGGGAFSFVANDRQEGLDTDFQTPLFIAIGVERRFGDVLVALTAEYSPEYGPYTVIQPRSRQLLRPSGSAPDIDSAEEMRVRDAYVQVLNVAVAVELRLSSDVTLVGSFRTDFAAVDPARSDATTISWDLYHAAIGAIIGDPFADEADKQTSEMSIGITLTFGGDDDFGQIVNFSNPSEDNLLLGDTGGAAASYFAVAFILGYTHYF
jgi:hypothetical protein